MNTSKIILSIGMIFFCAIKDSYADDVTITVKGRVAALPCIVPTTNIVNLGDLMTEDFQAAGSSSRWYPFTLKLTQCPEDTSGVTATFTGKSDNSGYYKNEGDATNIELELQDSSGTTIGNNKTLSVKVDEATQTASLSLKVRALSVKGKAKTGSIKTVINVTYTYS